MVALKKYGFSCEVYYTYIIDHNKNIDELYKGLRQNIRREIKKAERRVEIKSVKDHEHFFKVYKETFERQNMKTPIDKKTFLNFDNLVIKNSGRTILGAFDQEQLCSAVYILNGINQDHYLMGGTKNADRNSGAPSMLLWKCISNAIKRNKSFNFEGSMNSTIIRYFRNFGGDLTPYFRIFKDNRILKRFRNQT